MIKCPQCTKEFDYYSKNTRPFCSERCQLIDMGHWFEESYSVPDTKTPVEYIQDQGDDEEE